MNKIQEQIAKFVTAMAAVGDAFRQITYSKSGAPRGRWNRMPTPSKGHSSPQTRRGAKHVVNPTFKSRSMLTAKGHPVTPAQYRQWHLGKHVDIPNHMKPHPAPRARNVVKMGVDYGS